MDWITANAHHLLLGLMLFIGIGICVAVITFIRHGRDPLAAIIPSRADKPDWLIGTAFVVCILAGNAWLDLRDLRNADAAVAEQLVMTIATDSDLQPTVTGCTRVGQRMYQPKAREQVRG